MTTKHTPGPWHTYQGNDPMSTVFKRGRTVCVSLPDNAGDMAIAYCDYHTSELALANARLISAAPDLLATLRGLLDATHDSKTALSQHVQDAMVCAQEIIDKVESP